MAALEVLNRNWSGIGWLQGDQCAVADICHNSLRGSAQSKLMSTLSTWIMSWFEGR